ncbi:Ubiquitin fusion degradation protein 4 [Basidiobolus ranarum]|uniref:Ubiquitin fusion degradation protein 4 n=1 Tax=Basidiobolus ranarum TaxID=34480 RepID=A0ABR2WHN2_9FUNG
MEIGEEEKDSSDMDVDEETQSIKEESTVGKGKTTEAMAEENEEEEEEQQSSKQLKVSYASAAQKATDWHLEFSIGDVVIDTEWTIYKAIHQHLNQATQKNRNIWSAIYPVKYRKVPDSSTESSKASQAQSSKSGFTEVEKPNGDASLKDSYSQILQLLRELHALNTRYLELYSQTDLCLESLAVLSPSKFINGKLTAKMNRQLDEPMIVVSSCLPSWCEYLANEYPFLFPFGTRYLYLQSTAFGYSRSIARYQNQQSRNGQQDSRRDESQPLLGRIQRQKVRISRSRILESAVKVMDLYGSQQSILEVEYFEEAGTGLGPTLEFYATVSKEFCKRSLKLWRDDSDPDSSRKYITSPLGLFPRPTSEEYLASENGIKILNLFKAMGKFVAKALIDSRIIDLPFNPIFIKTLLNPKENIKNLRSVMHIDSVVGNSLKVIKYFVREKQCIIQDSTLNEAERHEALKNIRHQGASLEDLCLDCTLPGYPDIELVENGANVTVTIQNVEEYFNGVLEYTVGSGIAKKVAAFRDGFNTVFPLKHLNAFSPEELVMLFGQAEEDWSSEVLLDAIKADHGYTLESRPIRYLIEILSNFTSEERREFLQFVTGSPKLPIGGFKNLLPAFTIVCKPNELPLTPDDYLPSVMTCVNYLKMPNYSTQEIMRKKLEKAMKEGQGSFHLS